MNDRPAYSNSTVERPLVLEVPKHDQAIEIDTAYLKRGVYEQLPEVAIDYVDDRRTRRMVEIAMVYDLEAISSTVTAMGP